MYSFFANNKIVILEVIKPLKSMPFCQDFNIDSEIT